MSTFVHMELNTSDLKGAKKFYKSVLGWTYQDMTMPEGSYTMVSSANGPIGGMQNNPMPNAPSHWVGYAGVSSVAKTVTKVKRLGGKVLVPKTDVDGMGSLAIFTDPQGAVFGIWEAAAPKQTAKQKATKKSKKPASKKASKSAPKKASKSASKKASKSAPKKGNKLAPKKASKKASKSASKKASKSAPKKSRKSGAKRASTKTA